MATLLVPMAWMLLASFAVGEADATGPPCPPERPNAVCSPLIRPYSDNAFFWTEYCEFTAPPDVLIADSFSIYNAFQGW